MFNRYRGSATIKFFSAVVCGTVILTVHLILAPVLLFAIGFTAQTGYHKVMQSRSCAEEIVLDNFGSSTYDT